MAIKMKAYVELEEQVAFDYPSDLKGGDVKEWVWQNCKEQILSAMNIRFEETPVESELERARLRVKLLDKISHIQRQYLMSEDQRTVFGCLLDSLLELTDSEYGFIGEIKHDENGEVYLQTHAITNIAWDAATRAFYEDNIESGFKFRNHKTLFGNTLTTQEVVIANNPKSDPRSGGTPPGHPSLDYYLGIPFFYKGEMNGMVGVANKPGGYSYDDVAFLEPFTVTCSNLIQAYGQLEQNKHLINTLEEKVRERTVELELANQHLEEANKKVMRASANQLQHFANMNHEIRTPLNCIIGLSSLLQETELSMMQKDSLRMICTSGDLLLAVVNDVLDYSKLETDNVVVEMRRSDLQETLDAVVHSIEMKAKSKNLVLNTSYGCTLPDHFTTDSRRLQQILYNVLGNAIKFTPDGGDSIDFNVKVCSREMTEESKSSLSAALIRFVVKDYGPGIHEENLTKIFQPFVQASAETERTYGGTGLGLAITSKLVKCLGGDISVRSEIGKWTEFTIDLPLQEECVDTGSISERMRNITVLLVEDDPQSALRIKGKFHCFNVHVVTIKSMGEISAMEISNNLAPEHRHIFLVNERLYEEKPFKIFSSKFKAALLSYGPRYDVQVSKGHYRNPLQVLPVVLMQSMISVLDSSVPVSRTTSRIVSSSSSSIGPVLVDGFNVLIAEDNVINQKVLARLLKKLGVTKVDVANNGKEAVDMEAMKKYDIVFMDVQMPVMDGVQACRLIAERHNFRHEPGGGAKKPCLMPMMVFVTATVCSTLEQQAIEAGADCFVPKPFNLDQIEKCLSEVASFHANSS